MANIDFLSSEHSVRKEVSLFLSLIGGVLSIVALIATDWARPDKHKDTNPVQEVGLWRICKWIDIEDNTKQNCFSLQDMSDVPGWFRATQGLCVIGFILQIAAVFLILVSECVKGCQQNIGLVFAFVASAFCSSIFIAAALSIFGMEIKESWSISSTPSPGEGSSDIHTYKISWAFMVTGIGAGLQIISAVLGIWDAVLQNRMSRMSGSSANEEAHQGSHTYESLS